MDSPTFQTHKQPSSAGLCGRQEAVAHAQAWLGTPYVLGARLRGAGCDCATLLAEYLVAIGAAQREDLGVYAHDWFCHAGAERYLLALIRHARKTLEGVCRGTLEARPGSLAIFRAAGSHVYNHGAIVTAWPWGIHAVAPKVARVDLTQHFLTGHQAVALFDPWGAE